MNICQSVNEGRFCVFQRVISHQVACFCTSLKLRAFLSIFIIITLSSYVNCRNKKQKRHEAMCRKRLRKRVKLQRSETEKKFPHERIPHATKLQIPECCWAIHYRSVSQGHGWMSSWTVLISASNLTFKVRSLRKKYVYKILNLILSKGKGAKGEKHTRKAQIKERRQFRMRD